MLTYEYYYYGQTLLLSESFRVFCYSAMPTCNSEIATPELTVVAADKTLADCRLVNLRADFDVQTTSAQCHRPAEVRESDI